MNGFTCDEYQNHIDEYLNIVKLDEVNGPMPVDRQQQNQPQIRDVIVSKLKLLHTVRLLYVVALIDVIGLE